jgi:hypothetical protein
MPNKRRLLPIISHLTEARISAMVGTEALGA